MEGFMRQGSLNLPYGERRHVPGVAIAVKLHVKARAGETGAGAESLSQGRRVLVLLVG